MRPYRFSPAAWALVIALAAPPPAVPQDSPLARALHRDALDNGLEVFVVENHAVPLATVLVAVRSGAFTQEPGDEGLAHLYEHMLFRTYGRDQSAFSRAVGDLEGRYNGSTGHEVVTYWVMVPSERTGKAIELLGRLLTRARFDRDDLAEERRVVLDELSRAVSDPEQTLEHQVNRQLWGPAWHRRDVGGDSASLERITLERLQEAFERYYVPNNAAVIVTGDVSPPEVFREVERRFRDWQRGADPFAGEAGEPFEPLTGSRAALVIENNVRDVTVTIALHGPSLHDDTASTYAADALVAILNEPSSRFQQHLVGTGPFQWVEAGYLTLKQSGPITFRGKTTAEGAQDAVLALLSALDEPAFLLDLTDDDLTVARKARELEIALTLEAGAALAPQLAFWWASAGIDYYLTYDHRLNGQTLADLRRFAERYVLRRPKVVGLMGPPEVMSRVAEWLRRSAASRQ